MTLKEKLQKAWDSRHQIAEGFYNAYISNDKEIRDEAYRRIQICKTNVCGHFDPTGEDPRLVMKGSPGCTLCGCNSAIKTASMSAYCPLKDQGKEPLWDALTTPEQDKELNEIMYKKQFEKPQ